MTFTLDHLHLISRALVVLGVVLFLSGVVAGMNPNLTLVGAMLIIAGVVKVGMMWIWTHLAHMGTDEHHPEDAI